MIRLQECLVLCAVNPPPVAPVADVVDCALSHRYAQRHVKTHKVLASLLVARDGRNPLTTGDEDTTKKATSYSKLLG
jgi:hypothetical protein